MTLKEQIKILEAAVSGKSIQMKQIRPDGRWSDVVIDTVGRMVFWPDVEYRIKPEPRVVWVAFNESGKPVDVSLFMGQFINAVKFVEPIE